MTVDNGTTPSRPPGADPSGPLAAFRSPAAKLASVLVVAAGIIGGVYFVSGIEPIDVDPRVAVSSKAQETPAAARADSVIGPEDLPGFDTENLTDRQRLWLYHKANLEQCSCDCGMTVAQCRIEDPTCPVSPGRAREMVEEAARIDR